MSLLPVGIGGARSGYEIEKSLRFRASASAYLSRTFGSPTDATKWSYSLWVKRGALGSIQDLLSVSTDIAISLRNTSAIGIYRGGTGYVATSTALFRDVASHYHILMTKNGSDLIVYVNGVSVLTYTGTFNNVNTAKAHTIGKYQDSASDFFDGYLSEINFIDGQALSPSDFGHGDAATGQWVPKKYTGSYGANGFYLDFKDGTSLSTLGYDKSGNSNNWTLNNISLTAGVTYDWMDDTPSNNFPTINPLDVAPVQATIKWANMQHTGAANNKWSGCSFFIPSGKYYYEYTASGKAGNKAAQLVYGGTFTQYVSNGLVYLNGSIVATVAKWASGDVIGVAVDRDANTIAFYKNNTLVYTATGVAAGGIKPQTYTAKADTMHINFGQRPFAYTPPTGFKALCTKNLVSEDVIESGTFTGNANADGPFVWCNGTPETLTINSNAVTWGTHADRLANGFKLRTNSSSYNAAGSNSWTATILSPERKSAFKNQRAKGNP